MTAPMLFVVLLQATTLAPGHLSLEHCATPLWLSITDAETGTERDFEGCGDGPLEWFAPESMLFDADTFASEQSRFQELSAVVEGEGVVLSFRGPDDSGPQSGRVGFGTSEAVGERYRVAARPIRGEASVRIDGRSVLSTQVLAALAQLLEAEIAGAELMGDEPLTIRLGRIEVSVLLGMLGEFNSVKVRLVAAENRIVVQPIGSGPGQSAPTDPSRPPLVTALERLREALDSGVLGEAEALISRIQTILDTAPPQQVRVSALIFTAMLIERQPSQAEAVALLRDLDVRFFDFSRDVREPAANPVDIWDEQWILAADSIARAALRVAEDRLAGQQWAEFHYALDLAVATAREPELLQRILALEADGSDRKAKSTGPDTDIAEQR